MTIMDQNKTDNGYTVLIVDDEASNRLLYREILTRSGYLVAEAESGERALELLQENEFDLVITDLHMYQVSGLDVLDAAKQRNETTQVLILTGYGSIQSAVKAMRNGATDFLAKPINQEEFQAKVKNALERRKFQQLLEQQQNKLTQYHQSIERDLNLAKKIHHTLIPKNMENDFVAVALQYLPMIGLGGDFAHVYDNHNGTVYLGVIDVTGHGIAAALMVNRICSEVGNLLRDELEPREILFRLNAFFCDTFANTGMFATIMLLRIDQKTKTITYSGAAHPAIVSCDHDNDEIHQLESQNTIIGFEAGSPSDFTQTQYPFKSGQKIFLYTDGVLESEDSSGKPFGFSGLQNSIKKCRGKSARQAVKMITSDLKAYCNNQFRDDVLVLVAEMK